MEVRRQAALGVRQPLVGHGLGYTHGMQQAKGRRLPMEGRFDMVLKLSCNGLSLPSCRTLPQEAVLPKVRRDSSPSAITPDLGTVPVAAFFARAVTPTA